MLARPEGRGRKGKDEIYDEVRVTVLTVIIIIEAKLGVNPARFLPRRSRRTRQRHWRGVHLHVFGSTNHFKFRTLPCTSRSQHDTRTAPGEGSLPPCHIAPLQPVS